MAVNAAAFVFETGALFGDLDSISDDLANEDYLLDLAVGTTVVATGAFTAGVVMWTARAGYLVTLLSSSLPAWASIDPVPVLDAAALARKRARDVAQLNSESLVDIAEG